MDINKMTDEELSKEIYDNFFDMGLSTSECLAIAQFLRQCVADSQKLKERK